MRRETSSFDAIYYGSSVGKGNVSLYDERQFVKGLNAFELATLYRKAAKVRDDEFDQMVHLSPYFHSKTKAGVAVEWIHAMSSFHSRAIQRRHYTLMLEQKYGFMESYQTSVHEFIQREDHRIESGSMLGIPIVLEAFQMLHHRLTQRYHQVIFKEWTHRLHQDTIVATEHFHASYFNDLDDKIRGFIFKTEVNQEQMHRYADVYHMPMVTTPYMFSNGEELVIDTQAHTLSTHHFPDNEDHLTTQNHLISQPLDATPIQLFATLSDQRLIKDVSSSNLVHGGCIYRTESMYNTKGTMPSIDEFSACFKTLLESQKNKDVYIVLPNINPKDTIEYLPNHYIDLDLYHEYPALIHHLIKGIANAMNETKHIPKIVVPMVRVYKEVEAWTTIIETLFEASNCILPDIGFMIETESALEYHEDFKGLKFAIINMDHLIEELTDQPKHPLSLTFQDLKSLFWQDLKEMHQFFRGYLNQTKHIVMGKVLSNQKILDKLIKAGFYEFALPIHDLPKTLPVLHRYTSSRGKYKGVHEARKQKNQQI